jgi:hypothetical protein
MEEYTSSQDFEEKRMKSERKKLKSEQSIYERKSWKQIILIAGLLIYIGSLGVYLLINFNWFGLGFNIIFSDHYNTVGAVRVTTTGIATILIATGLLSLRKKQEIQRKKIIASAVLFLIIVPLKMALEMIVYNFLPKMFNDPMNSLYWWMFFVPAISLFTDFIPIFISTTIINSNILQFEQKLKPTLIISTVFQGFVLNFTIIIAILYVVPIYFDMRRAFFACTLIYGFLGIVMSSLYIIIITKWRRKINIKS